jgi:hypothetical protein
MVYYSQQVRILRLPIYSFCYSGIDVSTVFLSSHHRLARPSIGTCSEQFDTNRTLKTNKATEIESVKALKMHETQSRLVFLIIFFLACSNA